MTAPVELKTLELNVGGTVYTSTLSTLTEKWPESKLARLIKKAHHKDAESDSEIPVCYDSEGRIFIDRDGTTFRFILDYLRRSDEDTLGSGPQPMGRSWVTKLVPVPSDRYRFSQEADYYGLDMLVIEIRRSEQFAMRPAKPARSTSRPDLIEVSHDSSCFYVG